MWKCGVTPDLESRGRGGGSAAEPMDPRAQWRPMLVSQERVPACGFDAALKAAPRGDDGAEWEKVQSDPGHRPSPGRIRLPDRGPLKKNM